MSRPPKPNSEDAHSYHHRWLDDLLTEPGKYFVAGAGITISYENEKLVIRSTARGGASGDVWHFEGKIEVDPNNTYPAQSVIHIQDTHDLVTTGIRDAANPSGGLVTSCPGYWVSTQSVPPKTTVDGNEVWNLPQYPEPNQSNKDDPLNFWLYLGETPPGA